MTQGDALADQIERTREWTWKLLEDLEGEDWSYQPRPGLAHPLWLCGHLTCAQHLLVHVRCLGQSALEEEFTAHFPIRGPVKSVREHDYPSAERVLTDMADVHRKTLTAIRGMSDELLREPAFGKDGQVHPHYSDKRGAVAHCSRHEAFHAGQLALIRRLLGKPFLR